MSAIVVVPWHQRAQLDKFIDAWAIDWQDSRVLFQQDANREGCAVTKNKAIARAIREGAEIVIVLDDDCFPEQGQTIDSFINGHIQALQPQPVRMFRSVTSPVSRGTPYFNHSVTMPVAASMGFWSHVGDYDAPAQLVRGATQPMTFQQEAIFGQYFPLCGMNLAFRVSEWPWCQFINVPRFDDIWQGFLWQKSAYTRGLCFNLAGPVVRHSRQSNVWANLRDESQNLERNETIWQDIYAAPLEPHQQMIERLGLSTGLEGAA